MQLSCPVLSNPVLNLIYFASFVIFRWTAEGNSTAEGRSGAGEAEGFRPEGKGPAPQDTEGKPDCVCVFFVFCFRFRFVLCVIVFWPFCVTLLV